MPYGFFGLNWDKKKLYHVTAVQLHQVAYRFGNHFSIAPLSIDFPQNQITAIAGKSGSGKSILLKLMNGLLLPTEGEVRVFGEALNYSNIQAMRLKCGYMVQGSGLFADFANGKILQFDDTENIFRYKNESAIA